MANHKKLSSTNKNKKKIRGINGEKKSKRGCSVNKHKLQSNTKRHVNEIEAVPRCDFNNDESICDLPRELATQQANESKTLIGAIKGVFVRNGNIECESEEDVSKPISRRWLPSWLCSGNGDKKTINDIQTEEENNNYQEPMITKLETSAAANVYIPSPVPRMMKITSHSHPGTVSQAVNSIKRQYSSSSTTSSISNGYVSGSGRKKRIPKTLRREVWEKVHGEHKAKGKCYVEWCPRMLDKMEFQAGHNIPESKGGTIDLDNLFPICNECNQGMGDRYTIDQWSDMAFLAHIEEDFEGHMSIDEWNRVGKFVRRMVRMYPDILRSK